MDTKDDDIIMKKVNELAHLSDRDLAKRYQEKNCKAKEFGEVREELNEIVERFIKRALSK